MNVIGTNMGTGPMYEQALDEMETIIKPIKTLG
jgi:hypothetical protein